MIPSIESIKKFHGVCFVRKGPFKGETIRFDLDYNDNGGVDEFTISESNFEALNSLNFKGNNLKNTLVSIANYLTCDTTEGTILKIATESETILKLN